MTDPRFTHPIRLSPSSLVSTAAADIARRARNQKSLDLVRRAPGTPRPTLERMGFYPADVRAAASPLAVLTKALSRALRGGPPHKQKNRALLYGDLAPVAGGRPAGRETGRRRCRALS